MQGIIGAGSVEMRDLSGVVGRNTPRLITFALVDELPAPGRQYLLALAHMTDRAAYAYERAREALSAAAGKRAPNEIPIPAIMRAVGYLEMSLNALVRANLLGERLRRTRDVPEIERTELLSDTEFARARRMRHFAEHLEERIAAGDVGESGVSGLTAKTYANRIEFAGASLTYHELADWIERLDDLARHLLE